MKVAITGSSGLLGGALQQALGQRGWSITRVVRSGPSGPGRVRWDIDGGEIDAAGLEGHDVIIHLAGEPIAGLWTPAKKRRIAESRERGTALLAGAIASLGAKPRVLLSGAGTHYYGDRAPDEPIAEGEPPGTGFLPGVCVRWEAATAPAAAAGVRVVLLRTSPVLSGHGGLLGPMLPVFRLGLGARFGNGRQMLPWIALEDYVSAVLHILEHESLDGPVNLASPHPVSNAELTAALAGAVHRWALFSIPSPLLRLAPGDMADELLLSGARVVPRKLIETGFTFRWPELRPALAAILH